MNKSTRRRANLRAWVLKKYGDGTEAMCAFGCGTAVTLETMTLDHYPTRSRDGGGYNRGNVRPSCEPCNGADGAQEESRRLAEERRHYEAQREQRLMTLPKVTPIFGTPEWEKMSQWMKSNNV